MRIELQQIENANNIIEFRRLMNNNNYIKELPDEIKEAVLEKQISLDLFKDLVKLNDRRVYEKVVKVIERKKNYEKNILKTAKFAVKKSEQMKRKLFRLKEILDEGMILSSIWEIGNRKNYAGDYTFYGNAPTQVIEQSILRLTKKNDLILDALAGSGTTIDVCKQLGRRCIAYDINPVRDDIIKNDSRKIPLNDESVDMGFLHLPYWNMVKYSNDKNDLSRLPLNEFLESAEKILLEYKRVLKKEKYITILIGDLVENGEFVPLSRRIANIAEKNGLKDCGYAVKITKGSVSQRIRGRVLYAELAYTKNLKINHDNVMFWKKIY
jgi:hypothetical protein